MPLRPSSVLGAALALILAGGLEARGQGVSLSRAVPARALSLTGLRSPDDRQAFAIRNPMDFTGSSVDFASAALPFSLVRRPTTVQFSWRRLYQLSNVFGGDVDRYLTLRSSPIPRGTRASSITRRSGRRTARTARSRPSTASRTRRSCAGS